MNIPPFLSPKSSRILFTPVILLVLLAGCATKDFYAMSPVTDSAVYKQLQEEPALVDSVTVQAGVHYKRGMLYKMLWGGRHRKAWMAEVTVPVLQMDTVYGGLQVEKIGGGLQTISASILGGNGMTYTLRTVDKRPAETLPPLLSKTFLSDLARDMTSALSPYGALVVAPLASASGIHQSNPRLVYVRPNEEKLGQHKELLSDKLYLLEEKFNDERALRGNLNEATDIVGTNKMLTQRYSYPDHSIDQLAFAKARLMDVLIGDRDRHEGQWEWAEFMKDGEHTYRPIPKDRDNAFFRYDDGILSWLLSRRWTIRKYKTFHGNIKDVKALMIKSAFIDARAMPEVTEQQFDSLARDIQLTLTDQIIDNAVRKLPKPVYKIDGKDLEQDLRSRRADLVKASHKFYKILAEKVLVVGTDEADVFEVVRLSNQETSVTVRRKTDGQVRYYRIFQRSETDEIVLHGLDGKDEFELKGKVGRGIKIIIVGGPGKDKISDSSQVWGWSKKTIVYDSGENVVVTGWEAKYKAGKIPESYTFQRKGSD